MLNFQLSKSHIEQINGCRLYVKEHFSCDEWENICPYNWNNVSHLTKIPFNQFETKILELRKSKNWKGWTCFYVYKLALYRRISFPLDVMLSSKIKRDKGIIQEFPIFKELDDLVDKYYPELYKMDMADNIKKEQVKDHLELLVLRLWYAGYTLFEDANKDSVINEKVLIEALQYVGLDRKSHIYILGQMLELEPKSPVINAPRRYNATPVVERERRAWKTINFDKNNELFLNLFEYCFESLLKRVENITTINKPLGNDKYQRVSLPKITYNTWSHHSSILRRFILFCRDLEIITVDDVINNGVSKVLQIEEVKEWSKSHRNSLRSSLRQWLEYYINTNNLEIKIDSIFPRSFRRTTTTYGKILNLGNANELIQTLLTDEKGIIDENDITQFRCRRACLIQLATGQRVSEVCLLLKKSLTKDNSGHYWLNFHNTKKGKSHIVEVASDVVEWINQLKKISPSRKIYAPNSTAYTGDGLNEYRLFANSKNNGPLTHDIVNKFLNNLQKNLWNENSDLINLFTTHDFKRLQAIYMILSGKTKEQIQLKLGHSNPNSLIPYVATNDPKYQSIYKDIYQEGVWANITSSKVNDGDIELDKVLDQAHKMTENNNIENFVTELINKSIKTTRDVTIFSDSFLPVNPVSAGFPRRTHNCIANEMLNCGHTELSCFKCKKYRPDPEMLEEHKAEIFRFMILSLHGKSIAKKDKEKIKKELIYLRSDNIDENIEYSFSMLFEKGYKISKAEVESIKKMLWNKAKQYLRKNGKSKPNLTFREALNYLTY
ncbi:tyrosine-type recombinase/integrase [Alkalihalobacillus sp. BA299]|uniref:tyrosine-type recombinase/integrase n=1 Tax=Alkalihalobacillus sp. BA299 TaxID=2815938 RepID=UPI001ADC49D7|nr:tyrosine-type recombinase/integrase [Alkalihalobacillus sp. BA299]